MMPNHTEFLDESQMNCATRRDKTSSWVSQQGSPGFIAMEPSASMKTISGFTALPSVPACLSTVYRA
jgi:hypothetical protein